MFDARVSVASGEASEFAIVANYSGLEKSGDAHGSWRRQVSDGSLVFPERSQGQPRPAEYSDRTDFPIALLSDYPYRPPPDSPAKYDVEPTNSKDPGHR